MEYIWCNQEPLAGEFHELPPVMMTPSWASYFEATDKGLCTMMKCPAISGLIDSSLYLFTISSSCIVVCVHLLWYVPATADSGTQ